MDCELTDNEITICFCDAPQYKYAAFNHQVFNFLAFN